MKKSQSTDIGRKYLWHWTKATYFVYAERHCCIWKRKSVSTGFTEKKKNVWKPSLVTSNWCKIDQNAAISFTVQSFHSVSTSNEYT